MELAEPRKEYYPGSFPLRASLLSAIRIGGLRKRFVRMSKMLGCFCLLVVLLTAASAALAASGDDFFPIMPWDGLWGWDQIKGFNDPLESVAACNFTIAGFVQPDQLPECEKLGLKAIISRPARLGPGYKKWFGDTPADIDKAFKDHVAEAGSSGAILGYFVMDEPGVREFADLAAAVSAIKKYAPGKLAYINLYPGYATIGAPDKSQLGTNSFAEYLEKFVDEVKPDILSYDNYRVTTSDNFQSAEQGSSFFSDLIEVRRVAQEQGIPFWNVCCANRIRPYTTVPSPANLSLQAYATLAAGGRGLAWFIYYQHGYAYGPIDKNGSRTDTWFYLQNINRQVKTLGPIMLKLKSTGVFFTNPPAKNSAALPGKLVKSIASISSIKGFSTDSPPIMVGEFEGKDGDYVMLVNTSLEKAANVKLQTMGTYSRKEVVSSVDGSLSPLDEADGQWLVPGGGALIKLTKATK